ncbi:MAG: septum site-determining protein MinC [Tuberibacillus sp.]
MGNQRPLVMIKGIKDGLVLKLDDQCSYQRLIDELKSKLLERRHHYADGPLVSVKVEVGNRWINDGQREEIQTIIRSEKKLFVAEIESNVITKEECEDRLRKSELKTIVQIVRSGQILQTEGDVLLIGDVNPGGKIIAAGNIYILGALRGIAHAGYDGQTDKVIAASLMKPSQLMIGEVMNRPPDQNDEEAHYMECAYFDAERGTIVIDRLQSYFRKTGSTNNILLEGVKQAWGKQ